MVRTDGRATGELRQVRINPDFPTNALGSALIEFGKTSVLCGACVDENVPRWMRQKDVEVTGWVTGEYSLLPYSTPDRSARESAMGRIGGRTHEIQRLIGRSLRSGVNLQELGQRTIWVDCDVLRADGGTRTAAITGGFVALARAIEELIASGRLERSPLTCQVAAISVGVVEGEPVLDLCYEEDVAAEVDLNVVKTSLGGYVEIQGTAEGKPFHRDHLDAMLALADEGLERIFRMQREVLGGDFLWRS
jgi:ribonuclease PH